MKKQSKKSGNYDREELLMHLFDNIKKEIKQKHLVDFTYKVTKYWREKNFSIDERVIPPGIEIIGKTIEITIEIDE
ncbi:MAG: hypothetical protein ACTSQ8_26040 [Candidatus Helarchaeota archaeon]